MDTEMKRTTSYHSIVGDECASKDKSHGITSFESGSSVDCSTEPNKSTFGLDSDFSDGWAIPQSSSANDEDAQDEARIQLERISVCTPKGSLSSFDLSQPPTMIFGDSTTSTRVSTKTGDLTEVLGNGGASDVKSLGYPSGREKKAATSYDFDWIAYEDALTNGRERMRMDVSSYEAVDVDPIEDDALLFECEYTTKLFQNVKRFDTDSKHACKVKRPFRFHRADRASFIRSLDKKKIKQDSLRFNARRITISMESIEDLRMDAASGVLPHDVRTRASHLSTLSCRLDTICKHMDADVPVSEEDESPVHGPCKPKLPLSRPDNRAAGRHVRPHLLTSTLATSP